MNFQTVKLLRSIGLVNS